MRGALRPLVSADPSGDHCGQEQGLPGGLGCGLRQEVVGVGGHRFGDLENKSLLESAIIQVAKAFVNSNFKINVYTLLEPASAK